MNKRDFFNRESYNLKFSDVPEAADVANFTKIIYISESTIKINISHIDFYTPFNNFEALKDTMNTKMALLEIEKI